MKNWTDYSICSTLCHNNDTGSKVGIFSITTMLISLCVLLVIVPTYEVLKAQSDHNQVIEHNTFQQHHPESWPETELNFTDIIQDSLVQRDTVPLPKSVMYKSMIVPGWGQITNRQVWKVPVIYGMLAGVAAYTVYSNDRYQGYKAAYYNAVPGNTDQRFGPTPGYIPPGQPPELYRSNRNTFRNRRDLSIIGIFLVYGLNVADAYIFAHLRDFDVSDDLSASLNPSIQNTDGQQTASLTLRISF